MAMEERHKQIKEGAGRDESGLNREFIEMMEKWGFPLVLGLALIAGGYAAYNWYTRKADERNDAAYADLDTAAVSGNPTQLERVAGDHGKSTAVPIEAHIFAAEIHMEAARTGVPIGEKLDKDNKLPEGKSFLTDEQKKAELGKAEEQFKAALAMTNDSFGQTDSAIGALTGLASIAEDRGELDKAKDFYQQAVAKAKSQKIDALVPILQKRINTLDSLKAPIKLYAAADLPGAVAKPETVIQGITGKTATGETINLGSPGATPGQPGVIQIPGGGTLTPIAPPTGAPPLPPVTSPTPAPSKPAEPAKPADPAKPGNP
jgi:predicted negative regulator of RcsB-dependent stress response